MGKIIGLLNQKGGVGKSTLAMHLASALHHNLNPEKNPNFVAIYDSDYPQYSILTVRNEEINLIKRKIEEDNNYYSNKMKNIYQNGFGPMPVFHGDIQNVIEKIDELRSNYEYTIVDVVGTVNTRFYDEKFIDIFDCIIVPMSTEFDVIRSSATYVSELIAPIAAKNEKLKYGIVLNNVDSVDDTNSNRTKEKLRGYGFSIFDTMIHRRKKYTRLYMRDGSSGTLSTLFPGYEPAFIKLMKEILQLINE